MPATLISYLVVIAATCTVACEPAVSSPGEHFALQLHVRSTTGDVVSDARFWADGRELGTTDAHGALHAKLRGRQGESVALSFACPAAYRTLEPRRRFVLRHVESGDAQSVAKGLELTAHCQPLEHTFALVVRARGANRAGLPIKVRGEVIGQTQGDGTAHLLVRAPPNSALLVELDTSHHPAVSPSNPVQSFQTGDRDDVLLFEQQLVVTRRRATVTRARSLRGIPYRIN